ncbi:MAG: hypothetical protein IT186_23320 [Acidobacteria bacterium]|nr:hypothetical protein [Acidobacteriota bacterium]MCG3195379.1 hypothetical protein [Thermoanaerobaculia bacterium]MCK6682562.1 hypothetical protein [Thermoanaerobaculia bacterium]
MPRHSLLPGAALGGLTLVPASVIPDPSPTPDPAGFVRAVLDAYRTTPGTAGRTRPADRRLAYDLCARGTQLQTVFDALLLASARRFASASPSNPPPTVRSLAYFQGAIDELLHAPLQPGYRCYLERTLARSLAALPPRPPSPPPDRT